MKSGSQSSKKKNGSVGKKMKLEDMLDEAAKNRVNNLFSILLISKWPAYKSKNPLF